MNYQELDNMESIDSNPTTRRNLLSKEDSIELFTKIEVQPSALINETAVIHNLHNKSWSQIEQSLSENEFHSNSYMDSSSSIHSNDSSTPQNEEANPPKAKENDELSIADKMKMFRRPSKTSSPKKLSKLMLKLTQKSRRISKKDEGKRSTKLAEVVEREEVHSSSSEELEFANSFGNDRRRKNSWESMTSTVDIENSGKEEEESTIRSETERYGKYTKQPTRLITKTTKKFQLMRGQNRGSVQHEPSTSSELLRKAGMPTSNRDSPLGKKGVNSKWRRAKGALTAYMRMKKLNEEILLYGTSQNLFDIRNRNVERVKEVFEPTQVNITEKLDCLMYHPECTFKKFWTVILVILLLYTATIMPYKIAFIDTQTNTWFWIDLIIDCLFMFDIYVNLNSAFYSDNGDFIISRKTIFINYLKGWLIIDIVASIPMGVIETAIWGEEGGGVDNEVLRLARLPRLYRLLRIARLLKMVKFMKKSIILDKVQDFFQLNTGFVRLISFIFTVVTCIHVVACFWYFFAKYDNFDYETWVVRYQFMDSGNYYNYLTSVYWAFQTILTIGFGDICPYTTSIYIYIYISMYIAEVVIVILWMIFGAAVFAFTVGNLSSVLANLDTRSSNLAVKLAKLSEFCKDAKLDRDLRDKLRKALEYTSKKNMFSWIDKQKIFIELPPHLKSEVAMKMYDGVIENIQFFKDKDATFIALVIPMLQALKINPHEFIYRQGDHPNAIFFITEGRINFVLSSNNKIPFKDMVRGSYFGESDIIFKRKRKMTVRSDAFCHLLTLSKQVFESVVMKEYPEVVAEMKQIAKERDKRFGHAERMMEDYLRSHRELIPDSQELEKLEEADLYNLVKKSKKLESSSGLIMFPSNPGFLDSDITPKVSADSKRRKAGQLRKIAMMHTMRNTSQDDDIKNVITAENRMSNMATFKTHDSSEYLESTLLTHNLHKIEEKDEDSDPESPLEGKKRPSFYGFERQKTNSKGTPISKYKTTSKITEEREQENSFEEISRDISDLSSSSQEDFDIDMHKSPLKRSNSIKDEYTPSEFGYLRKQRTLQPNYSSHRKPKKIVNKNQHTSNKSLTNVNKNQIRRQLTDIKTYLEDTNKEQKNVGKKFSAIEGRLLDVFNKISERIDTKESRKSNKSLGSIGESPRKSIKMLSPMSAKHHLALNQDFGTESQKHNKTIDKTKNIE